METKFKVGDIVHNRIYSSHWKWKVTDIILKKQLVDKLGMGYYENCYIVNNCDKNFYSYINFADEDKFSIVDSSKDKSIINSSCPQCNGELKGHYSEWAGKDIEKCKECGWC